MSFSQCLSRCCAVDDLVPSEIIFCLVRNRFVRHQRTHSAWIKPASSSHHLSCALAVALIVLRVGSLVVTPAIRPVLIALIISNCWVRSPAFPQICFAFHSRSAQCHLYGYPHHRFACCLLVISSPRTC